MNTTTIGFETEPAGPWTEQAYEQYARYVLTQRAIPDVGDGLKPVQRRIVYAMHQLGLAHGAKHKKAARVVGDTLGKYHPHGDSACYEAMVLLAQGFQTRYPLVDGQGNWGSPDEPKAVAAMRYTEARLAPAAKLLLEEMSTGAVEWIGSFDGTQSEPVRLPARLPLVVMNGGQGIAVGVSSDIPAHNAAEIAEATIRLSRDPQAGWKEVLQAMPGPDWASGAQCVASQADIERAYRTGRGQLRARARWHLEGTCIVITGLPPQVAAGRIMTEIVAQMEGRKTPEIVDVRDESSEAEPVRIVIELKRGAKAQPVLRHLWAKTDLERTVKVNLTVLDANGIPRRLGIDALLRTWIEVREATVRRRLERRLAEVRARLHVIAALRLATARIEEVVRIVRTARDPEEALTSKLGIDAGQAKAVLALRLRALAKLEDERLRIEEETLREEGDTIETTLETPDGVARQVRSEIETAVSEHADERRTEICPDAIPARARGEEDTGPGETVTVVVSRNGWARAAKGARIDGTKLSFRPDDGPWRQATCSSASHVVLVGANGRCYAIRAGELPGARGLGEPLSTRLKLEGGHRWSALMIAEAGAEALIASSAGYGLRCPVSEMVTTLRAGRVLYTGLGPGVELLEPSLRPPQARWIACVSNDGWLAIIEGAELPELAKGKGQKMLGLGGRASGRQGEKTERRMVAALWLDEGATLELRQARTEQWIAVPPQKMKAAREGRRGRKGVKVWTKIDTIEGARVNYGNA